MKYLLVFWPVFLFSTAIYCQSYTLEGRVVDGIDQSPLIGTHISLYHTTTDQTYVQVTDVEGRFWWDLLPRGTYQMTLSYIGYSNEIQTITIKNQDIDLGDILLKEGVDIQEVVVTEQALTAVQKGDTTQFNANAFKTFPDASAEELIEKIPTVEIENGKVQAQGEDVKRVLVDGKPFFGEDATATLKNLPAELIEKIEIYDQQSDQAQFTGFDDGETTKTINIITKANMRNGQFGKITAGYGLDGKYQLNGNINFFNEDRRISILGMSNNINVQNFSSEDLLGVLGSSKKKKKRGRRGGGGSRGSGSSSSDFLVGQQNGISNSNATGINYSDEWGEDLEINASYFFNHSDNKSEESLIQQYFDEDGLTDTYEEAIDANSRNYNHRFSGRISFKLDERNSFRWRPKLSWQSNAGAELSVGQQMFDDKITDLTDNVFSSDLSTMNFSNSLLWRHKFAKRGRTLSANFSGGLAPKVGESFLDANNVFGVDMPDTTLVNQFSDLAINKWNGSVNLQYTEPMNEKSRLMFQYRINLKQEDSDKSTYDFDQTAEQYDIFNEELSNIFSSDYLSQQLGGGYNTRFGDWRMTAGAKVQWAQLDNEQTLPFSDQTKTVFWNVLPSVNLRFRPSKSENIRFSYRTSTDNPSVEQLQQVIDNSNALQLSTGNANLKQSTEHKLFVRYSKTNTEKSSVWFALLGGSVTQNYIANSTYLSASDFPVATDFPLDENAQISYPINFNGHWDMKSLISYGFPVTRLKSNLNISWSANYSRTPGMINERTNYANDTNTGLGLKFSSNFSENVDFNISSRSSINVANNTLQSASNTEYFNQRTRLRFNWIIFSGIIFRTNLTHQYYDGLADGLAENFLLWNMSLGKKLFKNDRGEISLQVFDLLGQNNSFNRNITETYIEDSRSNVLQRYLMLNFKYDLRRF